MIKYLITFAVVLIANICFLKFWYFKKCCIPISKIVDRLVKERNAGYNEGIEEGNKKLEREKKQNNQIAFQTQYEHGAELQNALEKIQRLETEAADFHNEKLQVKDDRMILKDSNDKFQTFLTELGTVINSLTGKSQKLDLQIKKVGLAKKQLVYIENDEIEEIKDEN